ncbi:MAG: glycoside hydrolase family 92 protein [Cyclobacteriaceae bacterium]|nr:glycoside hydrolase family 92 protein [Cyclobacteriaceae bacterium]
MLYFLKFLTLFFVLILNGVNAFSQDLTRFVNPLIGTSNNANTNPGAVLPWGMISISPFNVLDSAENLGYVPTPYIHGKKFISGFTHVNLSGTGCPVLGTFCLTPTAGTLSLKQSDNMSAYSRQVAEPGYYSVVLDKFNIEAELSTTLRTSISKYTFRKGKANILLNLGAGLSKKEGAVIHRISGTEVAGFKTIGDFCGLTAVQTIYFYAQLSKSPVESGVWDNHRQYPDYNREMAGSNIGAYFTFDVEDNDSIFVKLGISYVSIENARANLEAEQTGYNFQKVRTSARDAWNKELSKIKVKGGSDDDKVKFYTALYHMLLHPNIFNDVNGEYPAYRTNNILKTNGKDRYTVFSLWDTYRNVHPLLSLVYPKQQSDMVNSLLSMYNEGGWLPRWELASMETGVMVGDPSLPVIADTYLRGIRDFDIELAYEAMKHNATAPAEKNIMRPGLEFWAKYGYIPVDAPRLLSDSTRHFYEEMLRNRVVWGSVSTSLEYCIADWNLAQMAKLLGKEEDYTYFQNRSGFYTNNFDIQTGFIRPRLKNGEWVDSFNPTKEELNSFTEGNSWHYTFMVPHDIPGIMDLLGGENQFVKKLDQCFTEGHFNITNEPDIAYPYLFNYVRNEEWRTQKQVRKIVEENFKNTPEGLPGNDDCGTMSAWLLYSMMGFYPTCPGDVNYQITSPVFDEVEISLNPQYYLGDKFIVRAKNNNPENIYIKDIKINNKRADRFWISHDEMTKGGIMEMELRNNP